jgi:[phosphatase 2A protein]-leucine-carboxy methyltransferase
MPKFIGPWLAGAYDNDRLARTAAEESFHKAFPSEEKRRGVYRVYTRAILEHVRDSALRESARTLSDERVTSPDDAEAKYARVVATGISLLASLLCELQNISVLLGPKVTEFIAPSALAGLKREDSLLDAIIRDSVLWEYASHRDPFVRNSLYKLLITCLKSEKGERTTYQEHQKEERLTSHRPG